MEAGELLQKLRPGEIACKTSESSSCVKAFQYQWAGKKWKMELFIDGGALLSRACL